MYSNAINIKKTQDKNCYLYFINITYTCQTTSFSSCIRDSRVRYVKTKQNLPVTHSCFLRRFCPYVMTALLNNLFLKICEGLEVYNNKMQNMLNVFPLWYMSISKGITYEINMLTSNQKASHTK